MVQRCLGWRLLLADSMALLDCVVGWMFVACTRKGLKSIYDACFLSIQIRSLVQNKKRLINFGSVQVRKNSHGCSVLLHYIHGDSCFVLLYLMLFNSSVVTVLFKFCSYCTPCLAIARRIREFAISTRAWALVHSPRLKE